MCNIMSMYTLCNTKYYVYINKLNKNPRSSVIFKKRITLNKLLLNTLNKCKKYCEINYNYLYKYLNYKNNCMVCIKTLPVDATLL